MLLVQLALARKTIFPGLFLGWATAILALAVVGTGIGYRLMLHILVQQGQASPGLMFKANEIALVPPLFAMGMLVILLALQLGVDALGSRDPVRALSPGDQLLDVLTRATRFVGGLGILALLISGILGLRAVMIASELFATRGIAVGNADALNGYLTSSLVAGLGAVGLGLMTVVLSVVSGVLRFRTMATFAGEAVSPAGT